MLGAPLARDAVVIGAGIDLDLALDRRATLGIAYTGTIASTADDQSLRGTLTILF